MKKNIRYTDQAIKRLNDAIERLKSDIEKDIVRSKNYPGEEDIEITASDIESIFERVTIRKAHNKQAYRTQILLILYSACLILGAVMLLYNELPISAEPTGSLSPEILVLLVLFSLIALLATFSISMLIIFRRKNSEAESVLSKYEDQEKLLKEVLHHIDLKENLVILEKRIGAVQKDSLGTTSDAEDSSKSIDGEYKVSIVKS